MKAEELIKIIFDLKDFKCPLNISKVCVFCEKRCAESNYQEITGDFFFIKKTINSALLYLKVPTSDEIERSVLKYVIRELVHRYYFLMSSDLEEYDFALLVRYKDLNIRETRETIEKLIKWLLEEFPKDLFKIRMYIRERVLKTLDEKLRSF